MAGTFSGKFAFRSTNQSGTVCYLTSYHGEPTIYPSVSAPELTDTEKVMVYQQSDGNYTVVLVVSAPITGAISLAYLRGQADLGIVITDPAAANASELRISTLGAAEGTWSILDTDSNSWTELAYVPATGSMQLLTYTDKQAAPSASTLKTLLGVPVTPSYQELGAE